MGFLSTYQNHQFEDWGTTCSDDFKKFARAFKKYLTENGLNVVKHYCGHYDLSGFVEKNGKYVYYAWTWNRFAPVDVHATGVDGVLVREAESDHDYTGGINTFATLAEAPEAIKKLL